MDHRKSWLPPDGLEPRPLGLDKCPWYKNKLPSKFSVKSNGKLKFRTSLGTQNWVFLKDGIDDFRRGCPPCTEMITRVPKDSFLPLINGHTPKPAPKSCRKKLSKKAALFSRLSQSQLERKAFVEEMEARVKQNLLASCPNLEDRMSPKLLRGVLKVLDPDKQLKDTWAYLEDGKRRVEKHTGASKTPSVRARLNLPKLNPTPHLDKWLDEMLRVENLPEPSIPQRNVCEKIADFCEWAKSLGCEEINEDFIASQFDFEADCKPEVDTAQMKTLTHVPPAVIFTEGSVKPKPPKSVFPELKPNKKCKEGKSREKKKHVKTRYGAWYLPPKMWKKLREDEPLLDPNAPNDTEGFKRFEKDPDTLEDVYITIAFKDFILRKGYNMSGIIERLFTRRRWKYDTFKTPKVPSLRNSSSESSLEDV